MITIPEPLIGKVERTEKGLQLCEPATKEEKDLFHGFLQQLETAAAEVEEEEDGLAFTWY
ncbi:MAG: hypothetical protein QM270_02110 [Bacillota bacterium]|nr:hypothetical protein [Bacillota bacterium]